MVKGAKDYTPRAYQGDFDDQIDDYDEFMEEVTDDPARELGIPRRELKSELDRIDIHTDDDYEESDDFRETIEDRDEADDSSAVNYLNK